MSTSTEANLLLRLKLFESAVKYAWVIWNDSEKIFVQKSTCPEVLPEGEHVLENVIADPTPFYNYHKKITENVTNFSFVMQNNGDSCDVQCASLKVDDDLFSLWYMLPATDKSIFYLQNAAHDFRSPLSSILGVVNLMQHSMQSDEWDKEEFSTLLEMVKVNSNKTLRLADEIMELAEIESDDYELSMNLIPFSEFVQNYLATHRLLTLKKQIKVHFSGETEAKCLINESKLTRALDNILSNAVKFSKKGSEITFQLVEDDDQLRLSIIDKGIGMSEGILKNVFVKFGSSKRNGLDGEPSHGLGMSIVQQIMNLHHGQVEVNSKEGVGTTVTLTLNKEQ